MFQPSDVVEVQSGKSPEVQTEAADVLRRHGFEKESDVLAGMELLFYLWKPSAMRLLHKAPRTVQHKHNTVNSLSVNQFVNQLSEQC